MSEELKPCPFCGKTESLYVYKEMPFAWSSYVGCTLVDHGCGACGPIGESREEAIELWNRFAYLQENNSPNMKDLISPLQIDKINMAANFPFILAWLSDALSRVQENNTTVRLFVKSIEEPEQEGE